MFSMLNLHIMLDSFIRILIFSVSFYSVFMLPRWSSFGGFTYIDTDFFNITWYTWWYFAPIGMYIESSSENIP
jgi:hypothetical protein